MIPETYKPVPSTHLTEDQFSELLTGAAPPDGSVLSMAEEHVLHCEQCAAELDSLRESLSLFREASTAYANEQLRRMPLVHVRVTQVHRPLLRPMLLAAAAALLLAAFVPMQMLLRSASPAPVQTVRHTLPAESVQRYAVESNEALLEDVRRATSSSVPDAMQALADPTAGVDLVQQNSSQRKD
ncbi:MAG TPA: hypothetical protein VG714_08410 [Acidobacteriaceae bacterium]|nr:hypothetical protein [Acidobacteriaceae bacterium]